MANVRICDVCKKPLNEDNPMIAKMYLVPVRTDRPTRHENYTSHMDVGQCCAEHMVQKLGWRKRLTRKVAGNGSRLRPSPSVEAGSRRASSEAQ